MNKNIIISVLVVILVGAGIYGLFKSPVVKVERTVEQVGGSPVNPYDYEVTGDVVTHRKKVTVSTATTTICSILSPNATSTLQLGSGVSLTTGTTTNADIQLWNNTTQTSTSTVIGGVGYTANTQVAVVATTSTNNLVFAPNSYFEVTMSGGSGTFSPVGTCVASFQAF